MRKILLGSLILLFISFNVFSQTIPHGPVNRISLTRAVYTSSTLVKAGQGQITRIEYTVSSNNGGFAVYDALTPGVESTVVAEGIQPTATATGVNDYSGNPLVFTNGFYIALSNCKAIVTYQ